MFFFNTAEEGAVVGCSSTLDPAANLSILWEEFDIRGC